MTLRAAVLAALAHEDLNFLLTNRIPRRLATRFMGWFSRLESPLVRDFSIGLWRHFADLNLAEARKQRFTSLHDCFIRELREGARPFDTRPEILASPCDAMVGACGEVDGDQVLQAKGQAYPLNELLGNDRVAPYVNGVYATLRITSSMYHRFHAPHDLSLRRVTYYSGDTWNVNPIALKRVEKLFCRNERAVIEGELVAGNWPLVLVPVAAILVAGIRLHGVDVTLHLRRAGANPLPISRGFTKGEEMGWFEHGSTIIVFAPRGFTLAEGIVTGSRVRAGTALMQLPANLQGQIRSSS
jgi:phosphatidylserine decarboxylase